MTKEKQSLSVDVEIVTDESLHRRFTTPWGKGNSEMVDTVNFTPNPPSASSGGWSTSFGSPFAPNPRGVKELLGEKTGTSSETSKPSYHFHDWHAPDKRTHWELEKMVAPEKILTLFAMRLALLEKIATTVGKLTFLWATVVLLGGFAVTLKSLDFWFVTLILVTEGARIFVRSHELELEHQSPGQGTIKTMNMGLDAIQKCAHMMKTVFSHLIMPQGSKSKHEQGDASRGHVGPLHLSRAWSSSQVSLVPYMWAIFKAERVVAILNFMQVLSAVLSIGISVWRLYHAHEYDSEVDAGGNHTGALIMFYSLTVFEALVFLIERAYWQYKLRVEDILHTVNNSVTRVKLDDDCYTVRCFFYDVYAMCLTESVFGGLKMDLVEYSLQWLQSNVHVKQLHGVRALFAFSCNPESSQETLRTIGRRQGAVERLLEMVTWKKQEENDLREAATSLLLKLVAYDRTGIRVAAIAGSVEAIFSLFTDDRPDNHQQAYFTGEYTSTEIDESPRPANHVQTGLRILVTMAKNNINCARIGATKGLLTRLISLMDAQKLNMAGDEFRKAPAEETVWFLSLELLSLLAECPGESGNSLRRDLASNLVFVPNLRNILKFKEGGYRLQELSAGILCSLAMEAHMREVIGRTGGIMQSLFSLFLTAKEKMVSKEEMKVAIKAGEALTLLALQDSHNCSRMVRLSLRSLADQSREAELVKASGNNMVISRSVNFYQKKDVVNALTELMGDRHRGHLAIRMLSCFYDNNVEGIHKIRSAAVTSQVMGIAMVEKEDERAQDAAIGLAARTLPLLEAEEVEKLFSSGDFTKEDVSLMIVRKLEAHKEPSMKLPWVRRVCLELVVALVDCDPASFWGLFAMSERFVRSLDNVAATSSDLENYVTFSGAVGVGFHFITVEHLIQRVIDKLELQQ